jgi:hypothetical protein
MTPDYVDCGAVLAPFGESVAARTQVAFGAIAAEGVTPAFTVTGAAVIYVWGGWTKSPRLTIERSTDGGTTWTSAGTIQFHGEAQSNVAAFGTLTGSPTTTGTALYRLRLDSLYFGGPFPWAVYQ